MECASNVRKDHQFWMNLYDLIQQAASSPLETMERSSLILRFLGETKGLKTT
jgi:hypothetical protein